MTATVEELKWCTDSVLSELVHDEKMKEEYEVCKSGREAKIAYLSGQDTVQGRSDLCLLARLVYDAMLEHTTSFESENIGSDLAYLLGAIVTNGFMEWIVGSEPELYRVLKKIFPSSEHPVWGFIAIKEDDATQASE